MPTYVDTSGFFAYLCREDANHQRVREVLHRLARERERFLSTSYVLCETMGLVLRRLGFSPVRVFVEEVLPLVTIRWIGEREHTEGWQLMAGRPRRHLTIVDATGIAVMRQEGIRRCVALDPEFARHGFQVLPG